MTDREKDRTRMVREQILARGVRDELVLAAMSKVQREAFVPELQKKQAYADRPLPIAANQTISQPYIVAYMVEALALNGGERVLEIGAGSGYAAAVLAEIAADVFAIERVGELAQKASASLLDQGYENVHILHADGTRGWDEHAPFDAILVSAGAPEIPENLKSQLKTGGRLVVPIGQDQFSQELVRITRREGGQFDREDLADVRFVPLIGEQGWESDDLQAELTSPRIVQSRPTVRQTLPEAILRSSESFLEPNEINLANTIERIGSSRIVLIGDASHGTSEFYSIRAALTARLIEEKGFSIVAAEADWPDAARVDHFVRHRTAQAAAWQAFARFPTWLWRNEETRWFVDWLHEFNAELAMEARCGFYGLDLYSMYVSIGSVLEYLNEVDPDLADLARNRYGCLSPWEADPAAYGYAALTGSYRNCEKDVARMLTDLFVKRQEYEKSDGERFLDASQNAMLVANAERYYRIMYYGSRASWNLRDTHMVETLKSILDSRGADSKAVVWAHNSHVGDASATEMSLRGEHNLGQLCRDEWGDACYLIGMGTDHGTVAAASTWDGPMKVMNVRPSHAQSYERQFHLTNLPGLVLPLRQGLTDDIRNQISEPRLQRAIGVIYRPETELASHYYETKLPKQFDEYIWIDETKAIEPLATEQAGGLPDTYPFGV